jgi:hypothetical protein
VSLHPELVDLQRRLDRTGVVAVEHPDHLCVRLPLLCSVRVRYDGARLTTEPRRGAVERTRATALKLGGGAVAFGALLVTVGVDAPTLAAGFFVGLAAAYDVLRYVLTESAVTRVQALWAARQAGPESAEAAAGAALPGRVGARSVRELGVPTPPAGAPAAARVPVREPVREPVR